MQAKHFKAYRTANGNIVDVYSVTGTKTEIDDYLLIQSARQNKTVDELPKDDKGNPLFFYPRSFAIQNGNEPKAVYTLIKNFGEDKIIIDSTKDELDMWSRVAAKKEQSLAEKLADRMLSANSGTTRPAPTTKPVENALNDKEADIMEKATAQIGEETLAQG